MESADLISLVQQTIANSPQWLRSDLAAKDPLLRTRAEDALAAVIVAALTRAESVRDEN